MVTQKMAFEVTENTGPLVGIEIKKEDQKEFQEKDNIVEDVEEDDDNDDDDSDDFLTSELTGQTTLPNGIVIDKASAAYLKKTSKDTDLEDDFGYTLDKLQRKYAKKVKQGCEVIYVCINKGNSGLGIR